MRFEKFRILPPAAVIASREEVISGRVVRGAFKTTVRPGGMTNVGALSQIESVRLMLSAES